MLLFLKDVFQNESVKFYDKIVPIYILKCLILCTLLHLHTCKRCVFCWESPVDLFHGSFTGPQTSPWKPLESRYCSRPPPRRQTGGAASLTLTGRLCQSRSLFLRRVVLRRRRSRCLSSFVGYTYLRGRLVSVRTGGYWQLQPPGKRSAPGAEATSVSPLLTHLSGSSVWNSGSPTAELRGGDFSAEFVVGAQQRAERGGRQAGARRKTGQGGWVCVVGRW